MVLTDKQSVFNRLKKAKKKQFLQSIKRVWSQLKKQKKTGKQEFSDTIKRGELSKVNSYIRG